MKQHINSLGTLWRTGAPGDWRFILYVVAAIAFIIPALILAPAWRDVILGSVIGVTLFLLGLERMRARRRMVQLAAQLRSVASLDKLEVSDDPSVAVLDQALNDAIQRTREQAHVAQRASQADPAGVASQLLADVTGAPRSVAVLALGLRETDQTIASPETMEQLREIAGTVAAVAERRSALLQMQGSGTFALIFAAFSQEPVARSAKAAFDAAVELAARYPILQFGLSSGSGMPFALPGAGYTVIGSPFEEAIRLQRMSASWHEFRLLCPEPVALLLRPWIVGQRTPLQLTSPNAPPLPVYSLEAKSDVVALDA